MLVLNSEGCRLCLVFVLLIDFHCHIAYVVVELESLNFLFHVV